MSETVVVGIDGSEHSVRAIDCGVCAAEARGAAVHLLNAYHRVPPAPGPKDSGPRLQSAMRWMAGPHVRRIAMEHRKVGALMTRADDVVSVREHTTFKEIASLLLEHGISAVPVLDAAGCVAGVVSEADLMIKESRAEDPHFAANAS